MTYTPDSLREAAKDMFNADAEICRSHADAWENDKKVAQYAIADMGKMQTQYDALRKRLRGARIIIEGSGQRDDWQERADEWLAAAAEGEADIARAKAEASHSMSVEDDLLTAQDDNAALRAALEFAKDWFEAETGFMWPTVSEAEAASETYRRVCAALASQPESIPLSPDGPTDHLGETEDKP
jgi:hypothetical protein